VSGIFDLTTERSELRPVTPADAAELHAIWTSPGVRRFLWDDEIIPLARAEEAVATSVALFAERRFGLWAVRVKGTPAIAGFAGLWPFRDPPEFELLYGVAQPLWGRGYAVEASRAVLDYCYTSLSIPSVRASTDAANTASVRVLEKLGFTPLRRGMAGGLNTVFFERGRDAVQE
jgi:RimJ/RimL family protein N-acetyltransferase